MTSVTVDFIARGEHGEPWKMVLVEQGPWHSDEVTHHLKRLQARLYGCLDAAIDGQFAVKFPASKGKPITVQLDGYGLPERQVRAFFSTFAAQALRLPDYAVALAASEFVNEIRFELSLEPDPNA